MTDLTSTRHLLATLAYRGGKVLRDTPERFGKASAGGGTRTAVEILAHMCDVLDWGASLARGEQHWSEATVGDWPTTVARFHASMAALDEVLAGDGIACEPERLAQGPIADCLTHVGQIALLRRLAEAPIRVEDYSRAAVTVGRVGPDQQPPDQEFGG